MEWLCCFIFTRCSSLWIFIPKFQGLWNFCLMFPHLSSATNDSEALASPFCCSFFQSVFQHKNDPLSLPLSLYLSVSLFIFYTSDIPKVTAGLPRPLVSGGNVSLPQGLHQGRGKQKLPHGGEVKLYRTWRIRYFSDCEAGTEFDGNDF